MCRWRDGVGEAGRRPTMGVTGGVTSKGRRRDPAGEPRYSERGEDM